MSWAYDLVADLYDEDMGRNGSGDDISYYVRRAKDDCARTVKPVLELACGTGRVTWPIAASGIEIFATDLSPPMLTHLLSKARANPGVTPPLSFVSDMAQPAFRGPFGSVICAFSSLTYLLTEEALDRTLGAIRTHLAFGGLFHFDVFVPDPDILLDTDIFDYRRKVPQGWLERRKRITREAPGIHRINRYYTLTNPDGVLVREVETASLQRVPDFDFLLDRVRAADLLVLNVQGGFNSEPFSPTAKVAVFTTGIA